MSAVRFRSRIPVIFRTTAILLLPPDSSETKSGKDETAQGVEAHHAQDGTEAQDGVHVVLLCCSAVSTVNGLGHPPLPLVPLVAAAAQLLVLVLPADAVVDAVAQARVVPAETHRPAHVAAAVARGDAAKNAGSFELWSITR